MGVYSRIVEARFAREPAGKSKAPQPAPRDLEEVVADVGVRIQEIVDAAERVGALTQSLGFRIESLHREAQDLVDVLGQARRSLSGLAEVDDAPGSGAAHDAAPAPEPRSAPPPPRPRPVPDAQPASKPERIPEQAVLRAQLMAVAGIERTEIERMLRADFGVADPTSIVEKVLRSERA